MEKKKRKQHTVQQSSQLELGTLHIQGDAPAQACELKSKQAVGQQEALTVKRRKRDKIRECPQRATAVTVSSDANAPLSCNAVCVRNEEAQHVINDVVDQKTSSNMGITEKSADFSLHHDTGLLSQTQEKKKKNKKKKRSDQREQDSYCLNRGKNVMHISDDEDDMLFNFNLPPKSSMADQREPHVNSERRDKKSEKLLANDEISKNKKTKRKRDEGEHNSLSSDHHKESTSCTGKNDMVFNFATHPAVVKTIDYKSPVVATNKHATGSFQKEEKRQKEVFLEQKHLVEKEKKSVDMRTEGIPERNRSSIKLSESPSRPTFSIAVAGSIVDNAQSLKLATLLAGQIARAAAIFRVDEIVVFDDHDGESLSNYQAAMQENNSEEVGGLFMARILEYLEVPQYLRRALIPPHRSLSSVGKLPPLDAPHHLRKHEWRRFREGVVLDKKPLSGSGSCVDVGLEKEVVVSQKLKPGERVTVAMGHSKADGNVLQVVDRETARQAGFYWGYSVRYASCLSAVFDECPFEGKYDFCIGTSEHGEKLGPTDLVLPRCKHLLVAFGGLSGLEESMEIDKRLQNQNITSLFNRYINTCPNQGTRTIRTEEAILISLQFLQAAVQQALYDLEA